MYFKKSILYWKKSIVIQKDNKLNIYAKKDEK